MEVVGPALVPIVDGGGPLESPTLTLGPLVLDRSADHRTAAPATSSAIVAATASRRTARRAAIVAVGPSASNVSRCSAGPDATEARARSTVAAAPAHTRSDPRGAPRSAARSRSRSSSSIVVLSFGWTRAVVRVALAGRLSVGSELVAQGLAQARGAHTCRAGRPRAGRARPGAHRGGEPPQRRVQLAEGHRISGVRPPLRRSRLRPPTCARPCSTPNGRRDARPSAGGRSTRSWPRRKRPPRWTRATSPCSTRSTPTTGPCSTSLRSSAGRSPRSVCCSTSPKRACAATLVDGEVLGTVCRAFRNDRCRETARPERSVPGTARPARSRRPGPGRPGPNQREQAWLSRRRRLRCGAGASRRRRRGPLRPCP